VGEKKRYKEQKNKQTNEQTNKQTTADDKNTASGSPILGLKKHVCLFESSLDLTQHCLGFPFQMGNSSVKILAKSTCFGAEVVHAEMHPLVGAPAKCIFP